MRGKPLTVEQVHNLQVLCQYGSLKDSAVKLGIGYPTACALNAVSFDLDKYNEKNRSRRNEYKAIKAPVTSAKIIPEVKVDRLKNIENLLGELVKIQAEVLQMKKDSLEYAKANRKKWF